MAATAAIGLLGAGTFMQARNQYRSGQINSSIASINADIADFNSDYADWQAEDALDRGRDREGQLRKQVKQVGGAQRANLAAQGVDVNDLDSSAVQIQEDTEALGELDALMIRNNAIREAMGYRTRALNASVQGRVYEAQGAMAQSQGTFGAASTLLTGAGSAYLQYRQFME